MILRILLAAVIALIVGCAGGYLVGHDKGELSGKRQGDAKLQEKESKINDEIQKAYVDGCTMAATEFQNRTGVFYNSLDVQVACHQDAQSDLPWYNVD